MTLGVAGLIAAYIFIALLVLSINLYSRWSWPVKAGTVIAASALYIVSYLSVLDILGWPTRQALPERFRLVGTYVQQPDKLTEEKGAIYLWVTDLNDLARNGSPRSFRLPYSAPLHELVINATAKLNKGMPQMGEFRNPDDANVKIIDDPTRLGQTSAPVKFFDVPDPLFPDK